MANVINATSTGNGGLITTGDDSGVLNIQTNETTAVSIDASQSVDFTNNIDAPNTFGFKNRIINGNMAIDQRNGGSASTTTTGYFFSVDRFQTAANGGGAITMQQSSTVPSGTNFRYSLKALVSTADASIAAGDEYVLYQPIEGYNIADMGFGTASASAVTLSFWVRSSITGTYSVALYTSTRSYIATYTVNAADTFEYKTVSLIADTSGTYNTTNGTGTIVGFDLGSGSNYNGTASTWQSGTYLHRTSGSVNWIATSGATFYITGVQLEKGTQATSFDFRSFPVELAMCQRYYENSFPYGTQPSVYTGSNSVHTTAFSDGNAPGTLFKVTKRDTPTVTLRPQGSTTTGQVANTNGNVTGSAQNISTSQVSYIEVGTKTGGSYVRYTFEASAEM